MLSFYSYDIKDSVKYSLQLMAHTDSSVSLCPVSVSPSLRYSQGKN
jgi:hypothetical protein